MGQQLGVNQKDVITHVQPAPPSATQFVKREAVILRGYHGCRHYEAKHLAGLNVVREKGARSRE